MHDISSGSPVRGSTGNPICQGGDVPDPTAPTARPPMPTPTRVAVILLALLGILLLAGATLNWVGQEIILDQFEEQGQDREAAARTLLLFTIAYAVIGLSALLAAIFVPQRRPWARQVGLLVTSLLVVMTLLSAVFTRGIPPTSLLVLVAGVAAFTSLLSRQTKDWLFGVPTA